VLTNSSRRVIREAMCCNYNKRTGSLSTAIILTWCSSL